MRMRLRAPSPPLPRRAAVAVAVVALVVSTSLAACGGSDVNGTGGRSSQGDGEHAGFGHIHALGLDPADGAVYVAAHHGLFRIVDATKAERVAGHRQDTMGFTVLGPRTFVASGHPAASDIDAGDPPHLGLIRSSDAGRTWTTVSESGKADFHALQPAGTVLYAFDSQTARVRRSRDGGRTWTMAARLRVLDLAAYQDRPDEVYATTPQGVQVSTDGGGTFTRLAGAPVLTHLDAVGGSSLIGVDPGGRVHARRGGDTWQPLGQVRLGQVAAFTAARQGRLLAATTDGAVYESRDGGVMFTVVFQRAG